MTTTLRLAFSIVLTLPLAACSDVVSTPDDDSALPPGPTLFAADAVNTGHQTVFLNFGGGHITKGDWSQDNAEHNTSFIPQHDIDVPAFQPSAWGVSLAEARQRIIGRLRSLFAGYDVSFTATRPQQGGYTMMMIGGEPELVGIDDHFIGLSPLDEGNWNKNDVGFVFSARIARYGGYPVEFVGTTIAHELGHTVGLRHIDDKADIMHPDVGNPGRWGAGHRTGTANGYQDDRRILSALFSVGAGACYSGLLDRWDQNRTCEQSAGDGKWYECEDGQWVGVDHCTNGARIYGYCDAGGSAGWVPARSCKVQSDGSEVQCGENATWVAPVAGGQGPLGPCSREVQP